MAAWEAERAVLTRWAEEAKVLVKECEASRVAGLVNSLRVLSLTLCAERGACAEEEMEEDNRSLLLIGDCRVLTKTVFIPLVVSDLHHLSSVYVDYRKRMILTV